MLLHTVDPSIAAYWMSCILKASDVVAFALVDIIITYQTGKP